MDGRQKKAKHLQWWSIFHICAVDCNPKHPKYNIPGVYIHDPSQWLDRVLHVKYGVLRAPRCSWQQRMSCDLMIHQSSPCRPNSAITAIRLTTSRTHLHSTQNSPVNQLSNLHSSTLSLIIINLHLYNTSSYSITASHSPSYSLTHSGSRTYSG